ncbi:unnamed protein product [Closterium sp. Naga37s-1]|nr:unnamed protein product [Closterium sp. Naga37s-1]
MSSKERAASGIPGHTSAEVGQASIPTPDPPFIRWIKEQHAAALTRCDADGNDDFSDDFGDDYGDGDDGGSDAENDGESGDSYDIDEYHRGLPGRPFDLTDDMFRDGETDRVRETDREWETDAEAEVGRVGERDFGVPWHEIQAGETEGEGLTEHAARKMRQWSNAELMELAAAVVFCRHSGEVTRRRGSRGNAYWRQVWRVIRRGNPEWRRIPTAMSQQWKRMKSRYDAETLDPRRKRRQRRGTGWCPANGTTGTEQLAGGAEQLAGGAEQLAGGAEQRGGARQQTGGAEQWAGGVGGQQAESAEQQAGSAEQQAGSAEQQAGGSAQQRQGGSTNADERAIAEESTFGASTVAEGGAPQDCRFQPLTLLPEDHEDAEACNEYDYAACAEEDLDAYLESLPKSNRWTELEASCAWLDQANIRIEELDLTHGLPEHLVLNQPRAEHAPDTHHPRAPAGAAAAAAAATAAFPLPPAVPSASAAAAATAGDLPHKLSSHSSFSGVSTNTQQHKQHPTLRSLSSSLLTHLGFSPRPHSSPRSSPSPSASASASPIKTRQNPRRQSKEFALRAKSQQQIHHFQHPSAPLPIPHHHASSSPGVPHGPFHQSSSSPGVPLGPLHHSSSSPGMTVGPLYQSSSPKLPLAPINHTSSSPGLNISQASFHHSSSSPGMLIHPSAVPLTKFIVPENSGVQYQPGVLYSNIDGADMGGSSGIYSAKFNDAEEEITGVEIIGASNTGRGRKIKVWMGDAPRANVGVSA